VGARKNAIPPAGEPGGPACYPGAEVRAGPGDTFEQAVRGERARAAAQVARFRFVAVGGILAINLGFLLLTPAYVGPPMLPLLLYWVAAGLLLWRIRRRSDAAARRSALAIPLVDMPVALLLVGGAIERLEATPYAADASSVATQLPLFYLLLVLLASLTLEERYTWLAGAVAVVLQSALLVRVGRHPSFVLTVALATGVGTWLALYTRRRSVALVEAAAAEQARRERLGRYFSPQVAEAVARADFDVGRGERRDVTVMFADLRDFTVLSDRLSGEQVVVVLDEFHSRMVELIFAAGGTLDKFLGDGLMAYFGAPVAAPDHAERAVRCALAMQQAMAGLNRDLERRGLPELRMGIGLHTGSVILGDIGAARRREYTIVGDTVNVAARIEELTKTCAAPILVSDETKARIGGGFSFTAVEPVRVRGKAAPLRTYRVAAG
jgi:adenylate cyclase